jgi:hypothetical protein
MYIRTFLPPDVICTALAVPQAPLKGEAVLGDTALHQHFKVSFSSMCR